MVFLESAVDFLSNLEAETSAPSLVPRLAASDPSLPQPKRGGVVVGRSGPARQRKAWSLPGTRPGRPCDGEGRAQLQGRGTSFLSEACRSQEQFQASDRRELLQLSTLWLHTATSASSTPTPRASAPPSHTGRASSCLQASQGPCHLPDTTPPLLQVFAQVSPLRRIRTSHPTPSSSPFLALEGCVALATVHQTIQLLNVTARCWARCRLSARSAVCLARAGRPVGSFVMRCLITICGMKK